MHENSNERNQQRNNAAILTEHGTLELTQRLEARQPTAAFSHCIQTQHIRSLTSQ